MLMSDGTTFQAQSLELGKAAFAMISEYGLVATPEVYEVLYSHLAGSMPDLSKKLTPMLESGGVSLQDMDQIHADFFDNDESTHVQKTSDEIGKQVQTIGDVLSASFEDMEIFDDSLQESMGLLKNDLNADDLKKVLSALAAQTRKMHESNGALQKELVTAVKQIVRLSDSLEDAKKEAMIDGLTGVPNRRFFDETIKKAMLEHAETGNDLCLVIADIDHFKKFNDTYGHQTGDQVIKLVANILKNGSAETDTVARFGGEEFAIILPNTSVDQATVVCERIRQAVTGKKIRNRQTGADMGNITLSLGISRMTLEDHISDLIERADQCLYKAKSAGRNRVIAETEL